MHHSHECLPAVSFCAFFLSASVDKSAENHVQITFIVYSGDVTKVHAPSLLCIVTSTKNCVNVYWFSDVNITVQNNI